MQKKRSGGALLHSGHWGSCSSKHQHSLHSHHPVCSPGSWRDIPPVERHFPASRTPGNLGSWNTGHPGNAQIPWQGRGSLSRLTAGSRTGNRQVLKGSTLVTLETWVSLMSLVERGWDNRGGRMSRMLLRRRQPPFSGRRRRPTSRLSSGRSRPPAAWGSCCPPGSRGTRTMIGRRRRAGDPMVLKTNSDEFKTKRKYGCMTMSFDSLRR